MRAARMHEYGRPLILEDVPVPNVKSDEVLVQVKAAGMCRTDAQLVDGYFQKYAASAFPVTPGHEIAGVIDKIGSSVPKSLGLQEGDQVVVVGGWGDGSCRQCHMGDTQICAHGRWPGFEAYGGFAEFESVPAQYLIRVDKRLKAEELAPLTDAGVTPYRGIKKLRDAGALGPGAACWRSSASAVLGDTRCSTRMRHGSRSLYTLTSGRFAEMPRHAPH